MKQDKSIKSAVMEKIKNNEVKMTSRWVFIAQKIGLRSGIVLTILVLVFFVNAFFYYIKSNGLLLPLHYGDAVWQKLVHSLPFDLILIIIFLAIILNFFVKKFNFYLRRPIIITGLISISLIILLAALLFLSNFNYYLHANLAKSEKNIPFLTNFYVHRCCLHNICPYKNK